MVLASHDYVYGPGGQGILVDATYGGAVLYYHYGMYSVSARVYFDCQNVLLILVLLLLADTNIGLADADYQFGWNALSWSTGWPVPY